MFKTVLLSVQTIMTDFNASPTDDARDLVNAAQVMLTGERQDVRNLCDCGHCFAQLILNRGVLRSRAGVSPAGVPEV